jgi:hypothetical protein
MPPRKKLPVTERPAPTSSSTMTTESFDDWDTMVAESKIGTEPYTIRRRVTKDGEEHYEFVVIPVPSGAAYINLNAAQQRVDVAGILLNLTTSGESNEANSQLFVTLMEMLGEADFPVVDKLASRVLTHYFNAAPKAADGKPGGPGESSAS